MAYNFGRRTHKNGTDNGRQGSASVELVINANDEQYLCQSSKVFKEKFNIQQKVNAGTVGSNNGQFIKLTSSNKTPAAASFHNAKAILIKNISNITSEVYFKLQAWKNAGAASQTYDNEHASTELDGGGTSGNRYITFLLPAGDFVYLPNSRWIEYTPYQHIEEGNVESGAYASNGNIAVEPKDINSGNEYTLTINFTDSSKILVDGEIAATVTALVVDDGSYFKAGDLLFMDNSEIVKVLSVSGTTLTVERGLLGTTASTITTNGDINWFFGNEYLPYNIGKCMTDQTGKFKQSGAFFSKGRTSDGVADGLVAGSVSIGPFYSEGGYLDWGLQNIKASDKTGLVASTAYAITFVIDEYNAGGIDSTSTEQIVSFTTDASDTTFAGSSNAVLPKIQAQLDAYFYDAASGLKNKKVTIGLHNGDVRVTSNSNHSETRVGISKSTSGTTPFDVGRFPTMSTNVPDLQGSPHGGGTTDTIVYGPASSLALETIVDSVTGQEVTNTSAFLFDDGNGNLLHNGSAVGSVDYTTGHCQFAHLPNAEFKVYGQTYSAHSGGLNFTQSGNNFILEVGARSVNTKEDSQIQLIVLG